LGIDRGELYIALTNYRLNFSDQVQSSEYGSGLQSLENRLEHRSSSPYLHQLQAQFLRSGAEFRIRDQCDRV
jgi:hypothetical protein